MHLERTRPGELVAALAGAALLFLLFLDWVRPETTALRDPGAQIPAAAEAEADRQVGDYVARLAESGWSALGWALVALLVLTALGGIVTWLLSVTAAPAATPVAGEVITTAVGIIATLVLLVRLAIAQPSLDVGLPDGQIDVLAPAWLGLGCVLLITAGCWYAMSDERTEAAHSALGDIPVRPAPSGGGADPVRTELGG
jgi:hypothetical protein